MEKWKVVAAIGIFLLIASAYLLYSSPELKYAEIVSDLSVLDKADSITITASNFTAVQGHLQFEIAPVDGYLINATVFIDTDDPGAAIDVYSSLPVKVETSGYDNATIIIPPAVDQAVTFDVLFTFTNTSIQHPVQIIVEDSVSNVNATETVYALP